ncbi:hypothetical protein ASG07_07440 [Sphingomonas sp. Leaf343]|nr:hypothetical protein ASG07_07440 [Sphingomonas sp. Leaf343]
MSGAASAKLLVLNVAGFKINGELDDPRNTIRTLDLNGSVSDYVAVRVVSYDINLTAFDPSWLSEIRMGVSGRFGLSLISTPLSTEDRPGTTNLKGVATYNSYIFTPLDGITRFQFFDVVDDPAIMPDAMVNSGTVTLDYYGYSGPVSYVPEPATWAMMIGGFGMVGGAARRRRTAIGRVSFA